MNFGSDNSLEYVYELGKQAALLEIESEDYQKNTKKIIWLKMANELESKNYPKKEIYSIIHKILQDSIRFLKKDNTIVLNSSWLHDVMREAGYTDKSSVPNTPFGSDLEPELFGECIEERLQYVELFNDIKKQIDINLEALKKSYFLIYDLDEHGNELETKHPVECNWSGFFEEEGRNEISKFIKDIFYNEQKEWQQMIDTRQAIIPRMRFFIAALSSVVTNSDFCEGYYSIVKSKQNVTPKKRTQYWNDVYTAGKTAGMVANSQSQLFDLYKQDAMRWHFIDIPCPDCKKKQMRIKLKEIGTWWFVCSNSEYHKIDETLYPATLFGDRITQLAENKGGAASSFLEKNGITVKSN